MKSRSQTLDLRMCPPPSQIENTVVISDYQQMDRLLKEERNFIADICKKVAKTGCNVVLLQKSILRDAITDLGLHFLSKLKIMLIRDIERDQIEFICKVRYHPLHTCIASAVAASLSFDKH